MRAVESESGDLKGCMNTPESKQPTRVVDDLRALLKKLE